jgi:uncharacterized protein GlcG (DUF336 family)
MVSIAAICVVGNGERPPSYLRAQLAKTSSSEGGTPVRDAATKIVGAVSASGSLEIKDHVRAQAGHNKIARS